MLWVAASCCCFGASQHAAGQAPSRLNFRVGHRPGKRQQPAPPKNFTRSNLVLDKGYVSKGTTGDERRRRCQLARSEPAPEAAVKRPLTGTKSPPCGPNPAKDVKNGGNFCAFMPSEVVSGVGAASKPNRDPQRAWRTRNRCGPMALKA